LARPCPLRAEVKVAVLGRMSFCSVSFDIAVIL
jgi:hypothetical protein